MALVPGGGRAAQVCLLWLLLGAVVCRSPYEDCISRDCSAPELLVPEAPGAREDLSVIHVVYATDANQFPGLLASMVSLSVHLESPGLCVIHLIVPRADCALASNLIRLLRVELAHLPAQPNVTVHAQRPLDLDVDSFSIYWRRHDIHGKESPFTRYVLQQYLPDQKRALYIDADTLVKADVGPLYRMEMRHAIAAARYGKSLGEIRATFLDKRGDADAHRNFPEENLEMFPLGSGIHVLNLALWRSGALSRRLLSRLQALNGFMASQLPLQIEFIREYDEFDWRWHLPGFGYCPPEGSERCVQRARILHWSGPHKPWDPHFRHHFDHLWEPYNPNRVRYAASELRGESVLSEGLPEFGKGQSSRLLRQFKRVHPGIDEGQLQYRRSSESRDEPTLAFIFKLVRDAVSQGAATLNFLDVGAHVGATAVAVARLLAGLGAAGRALAVEPSPRAGLYLKEAVLQESLTNVDLYPYAIGGANDSGLHWLCEHRRPWQDRVDWHAAAGFPDGEAWAETVSTTRVLAASLDALLSRRSAFKSLFGAKIDTGGDEGRVLSGARALLSLYPPCVLLLARGALKESRRRQLARYGYEVALQDDAANASLVLLRQTQLARCLDRCRTAID